VRVRRRNDTIPAVRWTTVNPGRRILVVRTSTFCSSPGRGSTSRGVRDMRQQQITKRITRPVRASLDLRTPTGRDLPF